ncbi:MAG TPA: nucleotidyltransferase domain-containing protein [bacterium]|nr:nucleotidyltransferase domain-containing protein [bacterium]HPN45433.1 nucleotidyltransferase domain-containing protein [bacterium]
MMLTSSQKEDIKLTIKRLLENEQEINKIMIFGSFLYSAEPNDIDVAVFQNSDEKYLPLALKYRKLVRKLAGIIPVDIFPVRPGAQGLLMDEITTGEVLYEK